MAAMSIPDMTFSSGAGSDDIDVNERAGLSLTDAA
jgi:hypothetical protein